MTITSEISLKDFEGWSDGYENKIKLTDEQCDELESHLVDLYPDGMSETQLNDIFWHDFDWVCEILGIDYEGNTIGSEEWVKRVLNEKTQSDDLENTLLLYNSSSDAFDSFYQDEYYDEKDEDDLYEQFCEFLFTKYKERLNEYVEDNNMQELFDPDVEDVVDTYFCSQEKWPKFEDFVEEYRCDKD